MVTFTHKIDCDLGATSRTALRCPDDSCVIAFRNHLCVVHRDTTAHDVDPRFAADGAGDTWLAHWFGAYDQSKRADFLNGVVYYH